MNRTRTVFVAAGLLMACAGPASAQETTSVAQLLPNLAAEAAVITSGATGDHRNHFVPDQSALAALFELNRVVALQTGGFPFGPSSLAASAPARAQARWGARAPCRAGAWRK